MTKRAKSDSLLVYQGLSNEGHWIRIRQPGMVKLAATAVRGSIIFFKWEEKVVEGRKNMNQMLRAKKLKYLFLRTIFFGNVAEIGKYVFFFGTTSSDRV